MVPSLAASQSASVRSSKITPLTAIRWFRGLSGSSRLLMMVCRMSSPAAKRLGGKSAAGFQTETKKRELPLKQLPLL